MDKTKIIKNFPSLHLLFQFVRTWGERKEGRVKGGESQRRGGGEAEGGRQGVGGSEGGGGRSGT